MFYVLYYVLSILCLSLCAFCVLSRHDRFPFGHNKVKAEAEVNIRTTDGSDLVNMRHTTKRGAEYVMSTSEDK